jgi:nucleotide-binding universal stress UspA family protein/CBS domain-containing protein
MLVADLMNRKVQTIDPNDTVQEAAKRMRAAGIGILLVHDGTQLVGIVTDCDLTIRALADGHDPATVKVRDVMTSEVISCSDDQTLEEAARIMEQRGVRHLVVLDDDDRLAGLLSLDDLAASDPSLAGRVMAQLAARRARVGNKLFQRIIVPLDGSELAEQVLPYAEVLAKTFGATVVLVRAVAPIEAEFLIGAPAGALAPEAGANTIPLTADLRLNTASYLEAITSRLQSRGITVRSEHPTGRPAEVIVALARQLGTDLIAMTTHGRGGLGRAFFGSVADEVLRTAPCPVLLVRAEEQQ